MAALDDVGVLLLVEPGQAVAGALGGGGLQVVAVARFLLELHHQVPEEVHDLQREGQALLAADVLPQEVEAGFVHAHEADGVEVVVPVFPGPSLHVPEVVGGIGVQSPVRLVLDDLALDLQRDLAELRHPPEPGEEVRLVRGQIPDPGQVDCVHADAARHRVAAEETAAPLAKLPLVEAQPAAHAHRVLRGQVGVHVVGEVGDAVLAGDLHEAVDHRAVPVEILGDVDGGDGEREHPALGIPFQHDGAEGLVKEVHLLLEVPVGPVLIFAPDDDGLLPEGAGHLDVEGQVGEGALEAHSGGHVDVEDELLQALLHLLEGHVIVVDKGGAVGVEGGPGLGAGGLALSGEGGVDHLAQEGAEVLGGARFHLALHAAEAVHQQLPQIPARAVGAEEAEIVDMGVAAFVSLAHVLGVDLVEPVFLGEGLPDVVVEAVDAALHVGVFLGAPVLVVQIVGEHVDGGADHGVDLPGGPALLPIEDVGLGGLGVAVLDEDLLHRVLDILHLGDGVRVPFGDDLHHLVRQILGDSLVGAAHGLGRLPNGVLDLLLIEGFDASVALFDLSNHTPLLLYPCS